MFMIRWLIGIISFVPILFISIRCQTILAPQQLNLDGQDRFLIIFDRSAEDNGQQRLLRAKLLLSFSRSFNHVVYEDEIRTEKSIDEWTLPYVYRPQESSTTSTSKFKSFRFDQIFMKIIIEQPKKSEQIIRQFSIASNWNLGFFQSDKSIYKPSELVHLRFVRLNRLTFKPIIDDQCHLIIKNQQKIKMDFKNLTLKSPEYFVQYSYKLPTILNNNGEWEAEINCPETKYQNSLKFQVNDYVLPRFRIDIEAPPVHLCGSSDKPLIIRLRATYTYGRPVNGYAYFRISIQSKFNNRYPKNQNNNVEQKTPVECLNSTTGSLEQSIILSGNFCKNQQKLPQRLLIEAIVTDLSTNQKETSTINDQTILAKYPYRLWKRFTNLVYRPKLANYLAFELTDHDNNPMANIPIEIQMSDSNDHNIQPYILTSNNNNNLIQTDSNGLIIFTFKLDRNLGPLKVRIRSRDPRYRPDQQMSEEFTIFLFDYVNQIEQQQRQPVIQISNKKKIWFKAGQRFRSSLVYDGPIDSNQTYLIIMHHESIIHFSHLNSTMAIDIPLTNQMAPSIRMLVLAFIQYENRFVADFFRILIRQNNCGVQMKLGRTMVKPGQNLSITFDGGHSGDVLALKAIDESLEILQQKNQSSSALKLDKSLQNIYRKFIPGLDLTNQKSYYRSTDTISLIENFGLQILTPTAVDTTRHIRYRRNIHQCDRLAKNPCCQLAKSKFRQQISCEHRMAILRNHLNATIATTKDCLQAFFQCCQCSTMFGEPILIGQKHSFIFSQNEIRTMSSNVPETFAGRDDFEDDNDGQNLDIKRNDFRDSWLFDIYPLEHRTKTISKMVPHSITSWLISSISISKQDGFCVETPEQKLTVFKSFFIKISMPKSIVQYEQTEISATIYNYHNETLDTIVHFYHVDGLCSDAYRSLDKASTELRLMSNESKTIIYPIIGLRIGQFLIRIKAESGYYKDTIEKDLQILPPGETMEYSHSSNLDPTNRSKRNEQMKRDSNEMIDVIDEIYPEQKYQKINISIHRDLHNHNHQNNIVTGTIHHRLSLIGERFEPQLKSPEELSHLIRRRKSCGEQTAFYMAFNLHTMIYLKETNRLNRTLRKRGRKHLKRSYNDLISYRKSNDGSFAAFINRESSVWLTAFVSNLFCQSEQFLDDDEFDINMLSKSLDWILRQQQQSSGSWTESSTTTTHIHHRYADGGSNQNDETLTAFVLIALHQCNLFITRNNFTDKLQTNWSIDYVNANHKSFRYLLDEIFRTNHSYSMAIILYSLLLSPSSLPFLTKNDRYKWMEHLLQHPDRHQDGKLNQMYFDTGFVGC
ncbi:hypothetical protein DERP_003709 [Dermatophagoides pteronyssinus]|uniref:Complement C3-like n=1 Tax=Dermatophagoides pteronyssinus TaxID=6956 RepID=A0ABQ8JM48_DERPT|nr:hypothetical protein DERP_003709 [Dermatophagoides pteronyssinus]